MKVLYKGLWLAKGSKALELYEVYKKSGDSKDRKKLDDHLKLLELTK